MWGHLFLVLFLFFILHFWACPFPGTGRLVRPTAGKEASPCYSVVSAPEDGRAPRRKKKRRTIRSD